MSPVPEGAPTPGGAPPDAAQRPDVSRETWTAPPPESWADEAELDTPIGAEAERAVIGRASCRERVCHNV